MFSQYKYLIIGVAILLPLFSSFWYKNKSDNLQHEVDAAQIVVTQLEHSIEAQRVHSLKNFKLLEEQRKVNNVLVKESRDKTIEINKYKDREATVYRKPGLVEKLEQKALLEFFEEATNE